MSALNSTNEFDITSSDTYFPACLCDKLVPADHQGFFCVRFTLLILAFLVSRSLLYYQWISNGSGRWFNPAVFIACDPLLAVCQRCEVCSPRTANLNVLQRNRCTLRKAISFLSRRKNWMQQFAKQSHRENQSAVQKPNWKTHFQFKNRATKNKWCTWKFNEKPKLLFAI